MAHHPAHIDGCSLVILRRRSSLLSAGFEVVESGTLSYDGETLTLESDHAARTREVTLAEQNHILVVSELNRIPEFIGF